MMPLTSCFKVGIVIVSYHNPEMTSKYIKDEISKLTIPYTLVVVNNDSSREECQELAVKADLCFVETDSSLIPNSQKYIIHVEDNLGYAKGNNLGVQFLKKTGDFSHYLFTNDDISITDGNILYLLCSKMNKGDIAAIGPRVLGLDGRDQNPHREYISPQRQLGWKYLKILRRKKRKNDSHQSYLQQGGPVYWVSGAFMLVDSEKFDSIDGFDPRTFLYFEEVILAERFLSHGWHMYYEPSVSVIHFEGGSTNSHSDTKKRIEKESQKIYFRYYKNISPLLLKIWECLV